MFRPKAKEHQATMDNATADVIGLTAKIVSAHLSKTQTGVDALPALIQAVYQSLANAGQVVEAPPPIQMPAVPWKKSVFPDYIICLEDGTKLKIMKRYLRLRHGLTPDAYRAKWGLPSDYPMVAPNYAARRSTLALEHGLGRKAAVAEPYPSGEGRGCCLGSSAG